MVWRCRVSYVIEASNWYWLTAGQGLLSLQQVRAVGEYCYFFCTFIPVPLSCLFLSFISSTFSSISLLPFSGRRHKMTHKGWRVVKPQHNQSIITEYSWETLFIPYVNRDYRFYRKYKTANLFTVLVLIINTSILQRGTCLKKPASVARLDAPSGWRPGGRGFNPCRGRNILSWRLIMKYFLRSFSPFRWFKKGSCQFLAKECAQYWLTA